jgi:hypothetical protein
MHALRRKTLSRRFSSRPSPIVWEDIESPVDDQPVESTPDYTPERTTGRYYIPPPFSDSQLGSLTSVSDWPKSRVVWALGRVGYVSELRRNTQLVGILLERTTDLVDEMNSRDLVRIIQSLAYLGGCSTELVKRVRKLFLISKANEMFLVSFVYGNIKLMNTPNWTLTENCHQTLQFLLSEIVHRQSKIHPSHFLDITSSLLTSAKSELVIRHADTIENAILSHCVNHSIRHCKNAESVSRFARALVGHEFAQKLFNPINETLFSKFRNSGWKSGSDAIQTGFWFCVNGLMSPTTVDAWITSVREAKEPVNSSTRNLVQLRLVKYVIESTPGMREIMTDPNMEFLTSASRTEIGDVSPHTIYGSGPKEEPVCTSHYSRASRTIGHMVRAAVAAESGFVGPFFVPVMIPGIVVEWEHPWEFDPPHWRKWSEKMTGMRRKYLHENGWKLVLLKDSEFRAKTSEEKDGVNRKLASLLQQHGVEISDTVAVPKDPMGFQQIERPLEPNPKRIRREAKRTENAVKATLKRISKSWIDKHRKTKRKARKNHTN